MTISLDREGLDEFIELNPDLDTIDRLLETLVASRFISEQTLLSCGVDATLLQTGDLHLLLENNNSAHNVCFTAAQEFAGLINNPPSGETGSNGARSVRNTATEAIPQVRDPFPPHALRTDLSRVPFKKEGV